MKTITDYADEYVGHPQEIDEDLSTYSKREAYKAGMEKAFCRVREQLGLCLIKNYKSPILHLYDFLDKAQGRKDRDNIPVDSIVVFKKED